MRDFTIDTISFTDVAGKSYPIKDIRPIPSYTISAAIRVSEGDSLDEIASREDVYGAEGYKNAYRLFDANVISLVDHSLDISYMRICKVPF